MKHSILAIGLLACSFVLGACYGGGERRKMRNQTEFVYLKGEIDSTLYGTCLKTFGKDTFLFMSDLGDTMRFVLGKETEVYGEPEEDALLALMLEGRHTVKKLINISALMGTWVEPDPIEEGFEMGLSLREGGDASSINSRVHNYTNWAFFNGKLLLTSRNDMGGGMGEKAVDTFYIKILTADSLIMQSADYTYRYGHPSDSVKPVIDKAVIGDSTDYMQYMVI